MLALVVGAAIVAAACQAGGSAEELARVQAELKVAQQRLATTESFEAIRTSWERKAKTGPLKSVRKIATLQTFDQAGAAKKVSPKAGDLLVYETTGTGGHRDRPASERNTTKGAVVTVVDAATKQIVASGALPEKLYGSVHTTVLSPDGRYLYVTGPLESGEGVAAVNGIVKVDALTLQPLKVLSIGGRLHHAQVFRDKYILMDTFTRGPDGLDVFLLDPDTDEVVGGIRDEDLGGSTYTAFGDPTGEYIYILMEPLGYSDAPVTAGYEPAGKLRTGDLRTMKPFWVDKVKADTWEVVAEYPYPAIRSDWVQLSADGKFMYVNGGGDDKVVKLDLATGKVVWSQATGPGPYGLELTADGKEVWVADKGETISMFGRTITVIDDKTGQHLSTVPAGYMIDHLILSPDGKEIWATSNGDGKLYVYDPASRKLAQTIPMPGFGDAHGLVFVAYGADGKGRVVADQGDFHGGVDPRNGRPLVVKR